MIAWLRRWLTTLKGYWSLPVFEDEEESRIAGLAHRGAWALLLLGVAVPLVVWFVAPTGMAVGFAVGVPVVVVSIALLYLVHTGRLTIAGWLFTLLFYLMITWLVFAYRGLRDLTITGYFVTMIVSMLLLRGRAATIVSLMSAATMVAVYVAEVNGLVVPSLEPTAPPFQLVTLLIMFAFAAVLMRFTVVGNEYAFQRLRQAAVALRQANREMEQSRDTLADHIATLERRSAYLQASSEVASAIVSLLDVEQLLERVVDLIRERFGLYYVGIFMLDEGTGTQEQWVRLRAGTGAAGRAMLARGHGLRVGEGMIGWSVAQGEARVAQEAGIDQVRVSMPELPETRAEAALPLRSRGRVLGAITVQDTRPGAFDQEAVSTLQALADQVAVALDNARLLREAQMALEAERRAYGEASARGWARMVRHEQELGYVYRQGGDMAPVQGPWSADMVRANTQGEIVVGGAQAGDGERRRHGDGEGGADRVVAVPIRVRDRVIGVVRLQKPEDGPVWTEEELALVQTLTPQLEVALESARLYQDTQQRAARERMLGEATARMRETLDMDTVLRTATQQMRQTLGLHDVTIRLTRPDGPDTEVITPGGKQDAGS